jgi:hypothetical protein
MIAICSETTGTEIREYEEVCLGEIKNYVKPRRLYRYRAIENLDRELESIEHAYLYCAPYKDMNDPMEGLYSSSKRLKMNSNYDRIRREILSSKRQVGVCSFSEIYNHELMWAHYASQFRGICISYDLFDLLKYLPADASFVRVFYNEEVPNVGLTKRSPDELAKMVLSYKNHRWLYEREWRMFADQGKVFYSNRKCVARVYIGLRIDSDKRDKIEKRLESLKIPVSTMGVRGYSINFKTGPKY